MKKILLVEDNQLIARVIEKTLTLRLGVEVTVCDSASSALNILQEKPFDLIISDYSMPVMNGAELVAHIRESDKKIKIISYSIFEDEYVRNLMLNVGVDEYIVKDGKSDNLVKSVSDILF
jgi:CheY-like chemotaxis protein